MVFVPQDPLKLCSLSSSFNGQQVLLMSDLHQTSSLKLLFHFLLFRGLLFLFSSPFPRSRFLVPPGPDLILTVQRKTNLLESQNPACQMYYAIMGIHLIQRNLVIFYKGIL